MVVQYSDELRKAMDEAEATTRAHARAIGELCMSWAALDNAIDELFEPLLNCDRGAAASIATGMDKPEVRINIIRRLLLHSNLGGPWGEWVEGLFRRVLGELAPLRNRYVHDRWTLRAGQPTKIDKRARAQKPQSRQTDRLIFDATEVTPTEAVDRLREYVDTVAYALLFVSIDLERWRKTGRHPRLFQQLSPASKPRTRLDRYPTLIVWRQEQPPPLSFSTDP